MVKRDSSPKLVQPDLFSGLDRLVAPKGHKNNLSPEQRRTLLEQIDAKPFNQQQLEMVQHTNGPFLGLAGAGSGKTHAATHRIARLVGLGVRPARILAVTFTNKAAREMKDRVRTLLRPKGQAPFTKGLPTVRTLHGLGFMIVRDHADQLNYRSQVRIISDLYAGHLLQRGVDALPKAVRNAIDGDRVAKLREQISMWKNDGLSPKEILDTEHPLSKGYLEYQRWLEQTGFVDLDDLVRLPTALFTKTANGKEILQSWQERFDYVTVDEYQDTNRAQKDFLTLLAQGHRNICVVGDDDQAIYGWRRAKVEFIREFDLEWYGTKIVKLENNYRSTSRILDLANNLMSCSKEVRLTKVLRTDKGEGIPPALSIFQTETAEAEWVAETISGSGRNPGDFAILVRDQYRSNAERFEEALFAAGIPYEVWFTEEIEMGPTKKNAYSLLGAIHDPLKEEPAFLQLLKDSKFSISDNDLELLTSLRQDGLNPIWKILSNNSYGNLSADGRQNLKDLYTLVESLHKRARASKRTEKLCSIAKDGFKALFPYACAEALWNDLNCKNRDTVALRKIVRNLEVHEASSLPRGRTMAAYVHFQTVEIPRRIREGDTKKKAGGERSKVILSSIHGVKGLEFPVVLMPAFVEGVVPNRWALELEMGEDITAWNEAEAEERRLVYVGITRAEEELHISYSTTTKNRTRHVPQLPSRYILDMKLSSD